MPATSSWNTTSRISRVKVLVAGALAALTLSLGLQAADPAPASARMSRATCMNLLITANGLIDAGYTDAGRELYLFVTDMGCFN